jgi:hypothetical protein
MWLLAFVIISHGPGRIYLGVHFIRTIGGLFLSW